MNTKTFINKKDEKIKVKSLDIIVNPLSDKPYYEIKYMKIDEKYYHVGYSSFDLNNVLAWKDQYFIVVPKKKRSLMYKSQQLLNKILARRRRRKRIHE